MELPRQLLDGEVTDTRRGAWKHAGSGNTRPDLSVGRSENGLFVTTPADLALDRLAALLPAACMAVGCFGFLALLVAIVAGTAP